jgi:prevent-host-death family protein
MSEIRERSPVPYEPFGEDDVLESLAVSEFKATCLAVLERVRGTGKAVLVTKRGEPLARILPPRPPVPPESGAFGCMAGTAEEIEDILEPLPEQDWEALR